MSTLQSIKITTPGEYLISSTYADKIAFSVFGSGTDGAMPTGVQYTLKTAISNNAQLLINNNYQNINTISQNIVQHCGKFIINVTGTIPAGEYVIVEFVSYFNN